MSSDRINNRSRAEALRAMRQFAEPRQGIVTSYDPTRYMATATIMPEGGDPDLTPGQGSSGWMPVSTQWSGNGWGFYCPPSIGDQVTIIFQENDPASGIIVGRVFDVSHVPLNVPSGEMWLVHSTGSFLKLTNDGKIAINGHIEIDATAPTITLTATTAVNLVAPAIKLCKALGDTLQALCTAAFESWGASHTHSFVAKSGTDVLTTLGPLAPPPSNSLTTVVTAE